MLLNNAPQFSLAPSRANYDTRTYFILLPNALTYRKAHSWRMPAMQAVSTFLDLSGASVVNTMPLQELAMQRCMAC